MKITKQQLKRIIREVIEEAVKPEEIERERAIRRQETSSMGIMLPDSSKPRTSGTGRSRDVYNEDPYGPGGAVKSGFFKDDWKGTWDEEMVRFGYEDAVDGQSPENPDRKDYMEGYEAGQDKVKGIDWNEGY